MHSFLKRTWANINLDALKHNYEAIKRINPNVNVMAIIKADAYGHGAVQSARALKKVGASWFGVSNIEEAIELRIAGINGEILVLGYTPPKYADKCRNIKLLRRYIHSIMPKYFQIMPKSLTDALRYI